MPARGAILAYVREKFGTEPEYPWARYPHYAVLLIIMMVGRRIIEAMIA